MATLAQVVEMHAPATLRFCSRNSNRDRLFTVSIEAHEITRLKTEDVR